MDSMLSNLVRLDFQVLRFFRLGLCWNRVINEVGIFSFNRKRTRGKLGNGVILSLRFAEQEVLSRMDRPAG